MLGNMKNVKKIVVSWRRSGQLRRRAGPISAPVAEEVVIKLLPVLGDLAAVTAVITALRGGVLLRVVPVIWGCWSKVMSVVM